MDYFDFSLAFLCGVSLLGNAVFLIKLRASKKKPKPTQTAEDLLHYLTRRGAAIVKVEVVNPENLFIWKE